MARDSPCMGIDMYIRVDLSRLFAAMSRVNFMCPSRCSMQFGIENEFPRRLECSCSYCMTLLKCKKASTAGSLQRKMILLVYGHAEIPLPTYALKNASKTQRNGRVRGHVSAAQRASLHWQAQHNAWLTSRRWQPECGRGPL